jgi:hypothetical protein
MRWTIFIKFFILLYFSGVSATTLWAQPSVTVHAGFLQDSARIGDRVDFFLTARYPSHLNVLFPDSTFSFESFDFYRKKYFPTRTVHGESYDSVVYQLYAFDVSEIQRLTLPVFVVQERDCTQYVPPRDSLLLISMLPGDVPDSVSARDLPLKSNTFYQNVAKIFNYPLVVMAAVVVFVLAIITWLVFGKRIRKHYRLKKLKKNHAKFIETYGLIVAQLKSQFAANKTEAALSHWKKYLEQLERKPYTKLTTRETIRLEHDEQLAKSLQLLDKAIYGGHPSALNPLVHLQQVAENRFAKKLEEVKRG